jgi:rhomboid family GlyGly-CTERM serine protease
MKRVETIIYGVVIAVLNLPLVWGGFVESMILLPEKVLAGQWWRVLTHPFVHVSWYHLLLDGAAFFILYAQLAERKFVKRVAYVFGPALGSMLAAAIVLGGSGAYGYCGLSGLGHGLMAICSLELISDPNSKRSARLTGFVSLGLVVAKCIFEAVTGEMFLGFLHPDLLGVPIAISHMGGVISGCLIWWMLNRHVSGASGFRRWMCGVHCWCVRLLRGTSRTKSAD